VLPWAKAPEVKMILSGITTAIEAGMIMTIDNANA
jgi:hypothetical protein